MCEHYWLTGRFKSLLMIIGWLSLIMSMFEIVYILYHSKFRKSIRYIICIKVTFTLLIYPIYMVRVFLNCSCCPYSPYLFTIIPICFIVMILFSTYVVLIDYIKFHKFSLLFYILFFAAQSIIYTSILGIIIYKKILLGGNNIWDNLRANF